MALIVLPIVLNDPMHVTHVNALWYPKSILLLLKQSVVIVVITVDMARVRLPQKQILIMIAWACIVIVPNKWGSGLWLYA